MQLTASDIDRVEVLGAAFEQHVRESAGGGADIEANTAARIEAEMIKRCRELYATARNVGIGRARAQSRIHSDGLRRLAHGDVIGDDQPGLDRSLRFGAAVEQAALDQQTIGALAGDHENISTFRNKVNRTLVMNFRPARFSAAAVII